MLGNKLAWQINGQYVAPVTVSVCAGKGRRMSTLCNVCLSVHSPHRHQEATVTAGAASASKAHQAIKWRLDEDN